MVNVSLSGRQQRLRCLPRRPERLHDRLPRIVLATQLPQPILERKVTLVLATRRADHDLVLVGEAAAVAHRPDLGSDRLLHRLALKRWKAAERKQAIVEELEAGGLPLDPIAEELGKDLDPFDLICHVAFDRSPLTRRERAENVKKRDVFAKYGHQARAVLDALLAKYADEGVLNLDDTNVLASHPSPRLVRRCNSLTHSAARAASSVPSMNCSRPSIRRPRLVHDRRHHCQIHSGHHAPGRWRRWRRAAHQPIVLDVFFSNELALAEEAKNYQWTHQQRLRRRRIWMLVGSLVMIAVEIWLR
jgi:EcoEI R protein C-terminal